MRVTIKDVAAKTNLSITTVSLVLNNKPSKISQKTRELVIKTAKELNYMPNQIAVSMIKKRSKTVGFIVPDISNTYFSTLAKGVEETCHENGFNTILCNTGDQHERDAEYIKVLATRNVDGILYCMSKDSDIERFKANHQLLESLNIPYIMLDRTVSPEQIGRVLPCVQLNHRKGGYMATEHLLAMGHTKIGCITGPLRLTDAKLRVDGYKEALAEADIPFRSELIFEGDYDIAGGVEAVEPLLSQGATAFFASNDLMAYGACKALRDRGLTIPSDVSVVGYDDIYFSEILEVPLTTIRQPIEEMGATAALQLIAAMKEGKSDFDYIPFEPRLIIRASTRPPKATAKTVI